MLSVDSPVHYDGNVVVAHLRVRRPFLHADHPGLLSELVARVLAAHPSLAVLTVRLADADVEVVQRELLGAANIRASGRPASGRAVTYHVGAAPSDDGAVEFSSGRPQGLAPAERARWQPLPSTRCDCGGDLPQQALPVATVPPATRLGWEEEVEGLTTPCVLLAPGAVPLAPQRPCPWVMKGPPPPPCRCRPRGS